MERRIATCLIVAVLSSASLFADDKDRSPSQSPNTDRITALLQRIEVLERRVAMLEKQSSPPPPQYPAANRSASPVAPQVHPRHPYLPAQRPLPDAYRPSDSPALQNAPPINTPDPRWQKLEVNGHTFYVVPAAQAETRLSMPIVQPTPARQ